MASYCSYTGPLLASLFLAVQLSQLCLFLLFYHSVVSPKLTHPYVLLLVVGTSVALQISYFGDIFECFRPLIIDLSALS